MQRSISGKKQKAAFGVANQLSDLGRLKIVKVLGNAPVLVQLGHVRPHQRFFNPARDVEHVVCSETNARREEGGGNEE